MTDSAILLGPGHVRAVVGAWQRGVAVAGKAATNVVEGKPAGENLTEGVPGAVLMTAAPLAAHAAANRLLGRGAPNEPTAAVEQIDAAPEKLTPTQAKWKCKVAARRPCRLPAEPVDTSCIPDMDRRISALEKATRDVRVMSARLDEAEQKLADCEQMLDRFAEAVLAIGEMIRERPEVLKSAPRFTPVDRVDEVAANRNLVLSERLTALPLINENRLSPVLLNAMPVAEIKQRVLATV